MMFFNNIKPRRFNHRMIYSDERKERLKDIEERARRQLGMPSGGSNGSDRRTARDLHGAFSGSPERLRAGQRHARSGIGSGMIVIIIAILLFVMLQLLTGGVLFRL